MDEEEESVADVDPGEVLPKEKRRWMMAATSELRAALGVGLRVGLRWGRRWRRVTGQDRLQRCVQRMLIAVVAGYGMYGLLYLSSGNAKNPELSDGYASLHPLMRLGASIYFLFDRDVVVTDLERTAEDYLQMGLPITEASLHFKLEDRYVHAMDLRTRGRSPSRNRLMVAYFRIMGFRSLHHVASADHLHVSLPARRP